MAAFPGNETSWWEQQQFLLVLVGLIPTGKQRWMGAVSGKHMQGQEEMPSWAQCQGMAVAAYGALQHSCGFSAVGGWGQLGSAPHPGSVIPGSPSQEGER